jgi:hypothetical protein
MSSVRAARRWIDAGTRRSAVLERGPLVLLVAACAVLFLLAFILGRVLSPASQAGQGTLPRIAAAQAQELLPVRLSAVPPIRPGVAAATIRPARAILRTPASATGPTPAQAPAAQALAPPPPVPVTPTPVSAPAPAKAPERSSPILPTRTKQPAGGTSFDSSG